MKKWFKHLKNQAGMTLVELLAVVVILGIVAAIAVPSISNIIDNSKKDAHVSNALLIINAVKLGVTSNDTEVVDSVNGNTGISLQQIVANGFLDAVPKDPDTNSSYNGANSYVIFDEDNGYSIYLEGSERVVGTNNGTAKTAATESSLNSDGRDQVTEITTAGS